MFSLNTASPPFYGVQSTYGAVFVQIDFHFQAFRQSYFMFEVADIKAQNKILTRPICDICAPGHAERISL